MTKNKPDINICPHCGADLFEVGVVEAISGGYSETEIHFENGEKKTGITVIEDFIGHRLRPPVFPKSISIDMGIKCLT
jgi:alkyl hydroperoxide reductase subunit AhpF